MAKKKKKASKKKASKKGGARPGSGPKPTMESGRAISVWLGDEHLSILYTYGEKYGIGRSEAIRRLISSDDDLGDRIAAAEELLEEDAAS